MPALVARPLWRKFFEAFARPWRPPMRGAASGDAAEAADRPFDGEATSPRASRIGMGAGRLPSVWFACASLMVGRRWAPVCGFAMLPTGGSRIGPWIFVLAAEGIVVDW